MTLDGTVRTEARSNADGRSGLLRIDGNFYAGSIICVAGLNNPSISRGFLSGHGCGIVSVHLDSKLGSVKRIFAKIIDGRRVARNCILSVSVSYFLSSCGEVTLNISDINLGYCILGGRLASAFSMDCYHTVNRNVRGLALCRNCCFSLIAGIYNNSSLRAITTLPLAGVVSYVFGNCQSCGSGFRRTVITTLDIDRRLTKADAVVSIRLCRYVTSRSVRRNDDQT